MTGFVKKVLAFFFTFIAKRQAGSVGNKCKVNFPCRFTKKVCIGDNCHFNGMKIHGNGDVRIGNNFHSGKDCLILTSYHNYDQGTAIPYDDTYIDKSVTIEDNVWLGTRVTILGGVTLGEGCVIQAGSVVVSSIPKYAIAGGAPAKVFKMRDIEHYERLKVLGRFT